MPLRPSNGKLSRRLEAMSVGVVERGLMAPRVGVELEVVVCEFGGVLGDSISG